MRQILCWSFLTTQLLALFLIFNAAHLSADDWSQWRGPTGDNHADVGATAPLKWSEDEGLAWRTAVPGMGHSSPIVVDDRIYLTTADKDEQTQSLLIYNKQDGVPIKEVTVHRGHFAEKIFKTNSHASSTVASDDERVFTLFLNDDATWLTGFDLDGEQIWQQRVADFDPQQFKFGHGCSPVIVDGLVIVANEYDGDGSCLVAFDTATGKEQWRTPRDKNISFSTPAIARLATGTILLISGADHITAYDPKTGKQLWETLATTSLTCGTIVWDERQQIAFASGGYPDSQTAAVKMDGDHEVLWDNNAKCYEQSMLVVDDFVYAVANSGVAFCWRGSDGEQMWKKRLGGKYSSSPLLIDGRIYVTNEGGTTFVFKATPDKYQQLAKNQLGNSCYATPVPMDGRLYHRFATGMGAERQEFMAAIGE